MDKKKKINQIKRNLKDNKVALLLLLALLLIGTGTTYALWQLTFSQTGTNVITTACFKIEFEGQNDINLENAFPVTDEEGKKLTPYDFTITNVCTSEANYYVNLETVTSAEKKLSDYYLKANLLKGEEEVFLGNLNSSYINTERVISTASEAYKIYQGYLKANETATFHLNLWLDDASDLTDEVMNATYEGKITVTTSYKEPVEKNSMIKMDVEYAWTQVDHIHYWLNNTYTQNEKYESIDKIVFENAINPYDDAVEVVDFSASQDRSVLGYYVENEKKNGHILYIQADGKIKVNKDGSYYFMINSEYSRNYVEGLENIDTSLTTNMGYMFFASGLENLDLSSFDTSKVTNMGSMFYNCGRLTSLNLTNFDTSNVTNMGSMFELCSSLTSLDLSTFDTSKVTNMAYMFYGYGNGSLNLSSFDTSKVTNMSYMFYNYKNDSLNLNSFSTSEVTNMSNMFENCNNLTNIDLGNFDTKKVTDMSNMFYGCNSLTSLDLSSFNTSNVTTMESMFSDCSGLTSLNLGDFNTSKVNNMYNMFASCKKLTTSITIMNSKMSGSYLWMFRNAATEEGSGITVNYTAETSDLVDQMIATKSDTSNVVKGTLIS